MLVFLQGSVVKRSSWQNSRTKKRECRWAFDAAASTAVASVLKLLPSSAAFPIMDTRVHIIDR